MHVRGSGGREIDPPITPQQASPPPQTPDQRNKSPGNPTESCLAQSPSSLFHIF